jgi:hypothetical protein
MKSEAEGYLEISLFSILPRWEEIKRKDFSSFARGPQGHEPLTKMKAGLSTRLQ